MEKKVCVDMEYDFCFKFWRRPGHDMASELENPKLSDIDFETFIK